MRPIIFILFHISINKLYKVSCEKGGLLIVLIDEKH